MDYHFSKDLLAIREILGITQTTLAKEINVEQVTISRNELNKTEASNQLLEKVYEFAFEKQVRLNRLKEMLWEERLERNHKLLFHGAKTEIEGELRVKKGRLNNDFGQGFYAGETYEQAVSFVSRFENSSIYYLDFVKDNLMKKEYNVDQEWMMTIAYYRGALEQYIDHPIIKKIIDNSQNCDYIIAPIADNRMFQIIDLFVQGDITDEQCKHSLAATNLGKQYVFISEKAVKNIKIIERAYLCNKERTYYRNKRESETKIGLDKVKLARIEYRGKGKYIDEILG